MPKPFDKVAELSGLATFAQEQKTKHADLPIEVESAPPTRLSVRFGQIPQGLTITILPTGPTPKTLKMKTEPNARQSEDAHYIRHCTPKEIKQALQRILNHYKRQGTWLEYNAVHRI